MQNSRTKTAFQAPQWRSQNGPANSFWAAVSWTEGLGSRLVQMAQLVRCGSKLSSTNTSTNTSTSAGTSSAVQHDSGRYP